MATIICTVWRKVCVWNWRFNNRARQSSWYTVDVGLHTVACFALDVRSKVVHHHPTWQNTVAADLYNRPWVSSVDIVLSPAAGYYLDVAGWMMWLDAWCSRATRLSDNRSSSSRLVVHHNSQTNSWSCKLTCLFCTVRQQLAGSTRCPDRHWLTCLLSHAYQHHRRFAFFVESTVADGSLSTSRNQRRQTLLLAATKLARRQNRIDADHIWSREAMSWMVVKGRI